jgi:hypothetical protein
MATPPYIFVHALAGIAIIKQQQHARWLDAVVAALLSLTLRCAEGPAHQNGEGDGDAAHSKCFGTGDGGLHLGP